MTDEYNLYDEYKEDIDDFFSEYDEVWKGNTHPERDRNGFVWIASHSEGEDNETSFETLTVEPDEGPHAGGQYEIAVRFKGYDGKWSGYHITRDGTMIGTNTKGH